VITDHSCFLKEIRVLITSSLGYCEWMMIVEGNEVFLGLIADIIDKHSREALNYWQ
jgi:hypothetical protein